MEPSLTTPKVIRFGVFEADLRAGELHSQGLRAKLQEKPFQLLAILLERPGDVVTREELREKLWPGDTFVDFDHGINIAINKLREALGDSAEHPRYIETLPKRGYRFLVTASECPADEPVPRPRIRLVVLPFSNAGGDPAEEYFSDAVTDEIAHDALRHGTHNASRAYLAQAGVGILGSLLGGHTE